MMILTMIVVSPRAISRQIVEIRTGEKGKINGRKRGAVSVVGSSAVAVGFCRLFEGKKAKSFYKFSC